MLINISPWKVAPQKNPELRGNHEGNRHSGFKDYSAVFSLYRSEGRRNCPPIKAQRIPGPRGVSQKQRKVWTLSPLPYLQVKLHSSYNFTNKEIKHETVN